MPLGGAAGGPEVGVGASPERYPGGNGKPAAAAGGAGPVTKPLGGARSAMISGQSVAQ